MSTIKILPEHIANQIAAGEVVERPASVVKEFVENGIDAGATHITIEVEGGGTRLIRVIDNGLGMDRDDMLLCLERHGTSKIRRSEDLIGIGTLGFRGEAIPSIGSVSQLTLISRRPEDHLGCQVDVNYGTVRKVHDMGCGQGTIMEVRKLFGNVPARRKFLKTKRTELNHTAEVVIAMALSHPAIGFRYLVDGRIIYDFAASASLYQRVTSIYNCGDQPWVEINALGKVALSGFLSPPDAVSGVSARLRVFINGRNVRDRMVSHGVSEGCHGFYLKGRRPSGVLMIDVPPDTVDVNVHPTKQEVRFHNSQEVHGALTTAIKEAMVSYQEEVKQAVFGTPAPPSTPPTPLESHEPAEVLAPEVVQPALFVTEKNKKTSLLPIHENCFADSPAVEGRKGPFVKAISVPKTKTEPEEYSCVPQDNSVGALTYLGQFKRSYLLCDSEHGLVVIDQHAAHERLIYEGLKKEIMGAVVTQSLLFPEMMTLTRQEIDILEEYDGEIADLGVEISHFGGESYVVKAVPALLGHLGALEIMRGIFDRYLDGDMKMSRATRLEDILSMMACKAAVKANHVLLPEEGVALIEKMHRADVFSHCPHGRPVYQVFSEGEVKKWFLRT